MSDPTKEALQALFLAFPAQERTDNERTLVKVYLMAIDGISADFIAMACKRFIQGQVEGASMTFRPTPAELAAECRRLKESALKSERIAKLPWPPDRPRLTGPREPFKPYPKLWDALEGEPDLVKALNQMTFDEMTATSKLMATEGIEAAKAKLRRIAAMPARQKASAA